VIETGLVEWVKLTIATSPDEHSAARKIQQGSNYYLIGTELGAICLALEYHRGASVGVEDPFEPLWSFVDVGQYPPPLSVLESREIDIWVDIVELELPAILGARLGHLLWLRRVDGRHVYARLAIGAYRELSRQTSRENYERAEDLACALTLAKRLGDGALFVECWDELFEFVEACISGNDDSGVFIAAAALAGATRQRKMELPTLFEKLLESCDDVFQRDQALSFLALVAAKTPERKAVAERRVTLWISEAEKTQGLIAQAHLSTALEIARIGGLTQRHQEIFTLMQTLDVSTDLKRISANVDISEETYEAWIHSFCGFPNLSDVLTRFVSYVPIEQDRTKMDSDVTDFMGRFPLQFLFGKTILKEANLPVKHLSTKEDHFEVEVTKQETMRIMIWSFSAVEVLARIPEKWSESIENADSLFPSTYLPIGLASIFGNGLQLHWAGNHRASLGVVLPALETLVRHWVSEVGYQTYRMGSDGTVSPLSLKPLLHLLRPHLEPWVWSYLTLTLIEPLGLNIRNLVLHGSTQRVSAEDSALVIHIALVLSTLTWNSRAA